MNISTKIFLLAASILLAALPVCGAVVASAGGPSGGTLRFTVLYDNYVFQDGTRADWGFACLIEGAEKTILFDTGTKPEVLLHNAQALKVDLKKVELIVLSHEHGDHTGGLQAVLAEKPKATVYFPASFPAEFGRKAREAGAETRAVDKPIEICRNVHLTGEMGDRI